jgi:hypothetical protein
MRRECLDFVIALSERHLRGSFMCGSLTTIVGVPMRA